jgi:hypothetical protein
MRGQALVAGQEGGACHQLVFGDCHLLGCLRTRVQSALFSSSRVEGEGTRVFGFGPDKH